MGKKFTWKVWMLPNLLTKEVLNDSIADVSTAGDTKHNEDVAKAIKEEGSDLQVETLMDVINRSDRWKRRYLLEGYSVQDGNMHMSPRITGNWEGTKPLFDPKKHKITLDASPTAELRKSLESEVGVEVLGMKTDGGAFIRSVTDVISGKTDGTVTVDGEIIITGEKIRIEPLGEEGLYVSFMDIYGGESPVHSPLTQNDPKKVICRVPALEDGIYKLKIVTRFSSSSALLKHPRTIMYELPIKIGIQPNTTTPDETVS
jgi:hypothetical protein